MHRTHLRYCGIGLALALGALALTGGSPGGVALVVAALACPLAMLLALALLVRHEAPPPSDRAAAPGSDTPARRP